MNETTSLNIYADNTKVYKRTFKNLDDQGLTADLSPDLALTAYRYNSLSTVHK